MITRLPIELLLDGVSSLVTHLRMYFDSHVIMQTFDGAITVVNFHEGKVVYQRLEDVPTSTLDNDLEVVGRNVAFGRRNRAVLLRRAAEDAS